MTRRRMTATGLTTALAVPAAMLLLDGPAARAAAALPPVVAAALDAVRAGFEAATLLPLSRFALGALLLAAAALLRRRPRHAPLAPLVALVGATHLVSWLLVAALAGTLPVGSAVHAWALYFPIAYVHPPARKPLRWVALLLSAAPVLAGEQRVSDVAASAAIAALVTAALAALYSRATGRELGWILYPGEAV